MDFQDCVQFANENHVCYIATAEGDQPRVRALGMWFADDTGFYFQTNSVKAFYNQLKNNPKVEIAFYAPGIGDDLGTVMRVAGEVELVEDTAIMARLLEDAPYIKASELKGPDGPRVVVFRVYTGEAFFWTGTENIYEEGREILKF